MLATSASFLAKEGCYTVLGKHLPARLLPSLLLFTPVKTAAARALGLLVLCVCVPSSLPSTPIDDVVPSCTCPHKPPLPPHRSVEAIEPQTGMATVLLLDYQTEADVPLHMLQQLQPSSPHGSTFMPGLDSRRASSLSAHNSGPAASSFRRTSSSLLAPQGHRHAPSPGYDTSTAWRSTSGERHASGNRRSMSPGPPPGRPSVAWGQGAPTARPSWVGQGTAPRSGNSTSAYDGDAIGGNLPPDAPDSLIAESEFGTGVDDEAVHLRRAKGTQPPSYEPAPSFGPDDDRRLSGLLATQRPRDVDGLLTQGTSLYAVATSATAAVRLRGALGNRTERKRIHSMHRTGEFLCAHDLLPIDNPDTREALDDVRTHQFLLERARRAPTRLNDRLDEYRCDSRLRDTRPPLESCCRAAACL